jgi:hypothetical protein
MGLAERRAVGQFRDAEYPGWKARIDEAAGFEIPVDVEWDELAVADYAGSYGEFFPKVFFQPLTDALSAVTVDDLGKDAARQGLARIVIRNTGQFYSSSGFTFRDGVLTIDHQPHANVEYGDERAKALQQIIEAGL